MNATIDKNTDIVSLLLSHPTIDVNMQSNVSFIIMIVSNTIIYSIYDINGFIIYC